MVTGFLTVKKISFFLLITLLLAMLDMQGRSERLGHTSVANCSESTMAISSFVSRDSLSQDTMSHIFVATLRDSIDKTKATINGQIIFMAVHNQKFLYNAITHMARIADGRSGYIEPEKIERIDEPCFKFNFSQWPFVKEKNQELYQIFHAKGIDLNAIIKRIQNKDSGALIQFINMSTNLDGASAEQYPYDFWALINLWTDDELSGFIQKLNKDEQRLFSQLLIDSSFVNPSEYYELYYPTVYHLMPASK